MPRHVALLFVLLSLPASLARASDDEWDGDEGGPHLEVSHTIGMGTMMTEDPPYFAGTVEFAFVAYLDRSFAHEDNDDSLIWGLFMGDVMGIAPRAAILANGSQSAAPWAVTVGGGLVFLNRLADEFIRLPTVLGTLLPEIGAVFRAFTDTAFYLSWELPFSMRMDEHVAIDIALRAYVIDDWLSPRVEEPGVEPWEWMTTVSIGLRLIE